MKVEVVEPADVALRTLSEDDRERVNVWLGHLRNWETDEFVRERSHQLPSFQNTYVLQTSTDVRIFFTKDGDTITVYDVAKRPGILVSGNLSGGETR